MKNLKQETAPQSAKKLAIKAAILVSMVLVLWIPLTMIESVTEDRMDHQKEADRTIAGNHYDEVALGFAFEFTAQISGSSAVAYTVYPDKLDVQTDMGHQYLSKGRYEVLTYNADVKYHAQVSIANQISDTQAYGTIDTASIKLVVTNTSYSATVAQIPVKLGENGTAIVDGKLTIGGLESFAVTTKGNTSLTIAGDWPNPDFAAMGILPTSRQVTANGFTASWQCNAKSAAHQQMGVKLLVPVSQYQMTMRTLKYGMLIIVLTFAMFFITELWRKRSINIVQYFLAGLALVIFYSLLLSISEYMRFAYAYLIASAMTIGLVMIYLSSVLGNKKNAVVITSLLTLLYLYVYILTQMETYSLIAGSVGLFVILAVIMYTSQRLFTSQTKPVDQALDNVH